METAPIISRMAQGWNRKAADTTLGTARTGLSAALWRFEESAAFELTADPSPETHIVSLPVIGRHRSAYFGDGRKRFDKMMGNWHVNIVPAGEVPRAIMQPETPLGYLHVYLPTELMAHCAEGLEAHGPVELHDPCSAPDAAIERIAREMLCEMREGLPLSALRIDVLGQDLAIHLLRSWSSLADRVPSRGGAPCGGLAPFRLRRATEFIEENLARDIGLAELAAEVGLSPRHFCTAFRQSTGVPPHRYLVQRRIERAKTLLAGTAPIAEIAVACGFASQQHLTSVFRKLTGTTPAAWRRSVSGIAP